MFRQVRFECAACGEGFVDWHDDDWERSSVFCVHCGTAIVARGSLAPLSAAPASAPSEESRQARALGVLRGEGAGFRDTLPGLTLAPVSPDGAEVNPGASTATSTLPKGSARDASGWARHRHTLAPVAALLIGLTAGAASALLFENPLLRLMSPAAYRSRQLGEQLSSVSSAIDRGNWDRARALLERAQALSPAGDSRVAALRARLTLGLILANRRADAGHELAALPKSPLVHPTAAELQRVYEAWFPDQANSATTNAAAPPAAASAAPPKAKVVVTRRELLSFARDRQRRAQLDEADRLYAEVLRTHPNDAEARCGQAEVLLLRGGTDDGAKLFERALSDHANYAPAWVGLADVDWLRGHPERAACRYQAVIDRFPASSYPPYIAQRVAQVMNSGVNLPKARTDVDAVDACNP
ncbi:MAG TPA: tetratricopeptide repeat protein [Polyangiaceae bacterium]|nr:tetratricopeptide repeat protein [Polyangiaceae bacterium]